MFALQHELVGATRTVQYNIMHNPILNSSINSVSSEYSFLVWDLRATVAVPASLVVQVLSSQASHLALHAAGVPFHNVAVSTGQ